MIVIPVKILLLAIFMTLTSSSTVAVVADGTGVVAGAASAVAD